MLRPIAILLTDTHLDESNLEVNYNIFFQTAQYCVDNGFNAIYHLGDIFKSRKAQSLSVLDMFSKILDMLQKFGIQLVVIPGNHDKTCYQEERSFLDPFKHHPSLSLISTYFNCPIAEGIVVHFIPFFSDVEYVEMLRSTASFIDNTNYNILFTHIGVSGAVMNNGMTVDGVPQEEFKWFTRVYIGHYHDKQVMNEKFNYIGSSLQHNFGETPDKGLTVLFNDLSFQTVDLEFPRYLKIHVDVDKLTPKEILEIKQVKEESGDNLRVILTGKEEKVKSFNKQQLLEIGVSVQVEVDEIEKAEVDERVQPFTSLAIQEEFDRFCEKNKIEDKDKGWNYLKQVL